MTKLMTLVAIAAISLGSPEIRNDKGRVLAKNTRRDIEPGKRFDVDEDIGQDLKDKLAARDPVDDDDGSPLDEEAAIRSKAIADSIAQATASRAAQELAEAQAIAAAEAEKAVKAAEEAEAKAIADALAAAAAGDTAPPADGPSGDDTVEGGEGGSQGPLDLGAPGQ